MNTLTHLCLRVPTEIVVRILDALDNDLLIEDALYKIFEEKYYDLVLL